MNIPEGVGVNALKGATLISTELQLIPEIQNFLCQCPERGDTHFYCDLKAATLLSEIVSMP